MPTTYFISTGKSLSDQSRCWKDQDTFSSAGASEELDALDDELLASRLDYGDVRKHLQDCRAKALAGLEAGHPIGDWFRSECWTDARKFRLLPAELATMAVMSHGRPSPVFTAGDSLHILIGKTNAREGRAIHSILLDLVRTDPAMRGLDVGMSTDIGWDPLDYGTFERAMRELWVSIQDHNPALILTGGYKGVLLQLAWDASRDRPTVPLYYLYEGTDTVIRIGGLRAGPRVITV